MHWCEARGIDYLFGLARNSRLEEMLAPALGDAHVRYLATGVAAAPTSGSVTVAPAASTDFDLHPAVVLRKGEHNPAFFISWRSQKEIVRSRGWQSMAMIWGGPAIALLCLYYLLEYLRWL